MYDDLYIMQVHLFEIFYITALIIYYYLFITKNIYLHSKNGVALMIDASSE